MQITLAIIKGKPVLFELEDDTIRIDGCEEAIKDIGEADLKEFQAEVEAIPKDDDPGYEALVNSVRAVFLAKLLEHAIDAESRERIQSLLDHVQSDVLKYLGGEED